MSIAGLLLGVLDAIIVGVALVLVGAIVAWIATEFKWPIPENIQRLYLLMVLLIVVYLIIALLFGLPAIHILRGAG